VTKLVVWRSATLSNSGSGKIEEHKSLTRGTSLEIGVPVSALRLGMFLLPSLDLPKRFDKKYPTAELASQF